MTETVLTEKNTECLKIGILVKIIYSVEIEPSEKKNSDHFLGQYWTLKLNFRTSAYLNR
jgi:hypothetical protein